MLVQRKRNLNGRAKACWIQGIRDIKATIAHVTKVLQACVNEGRWGLILYWSILNDKIRRLIKRFYFHCLDHVVLTSFSELINYGKNYYIENCLLETPTQISGTLSCIS